MSLRPRSVSDMNGPNFPSEFVFVTENCGTTSIPPGCLPTVNTCINTMGTGCGDGTNASKCLCITKGACGTERCGTEGCTSAARPNLDCPLDTSGCQPESQYLRGCYEPVSNESQCQTDCLCFTTGKETFDDNCLVSPTEECEEPPMSQNDAETCPGIDETAFCEYFTIQCDNNDNS